MRVLFVTENFPLVTNGVFEITGGVEAAALGCARWLARSHTLRVLTNHRQAPAECVCEGIEVLQCGREGGYTQTGGIRQRASFQQRAVTAGETFRPDIVVGWNFVSYPPAHKVARRCRVPAIAWYADVWVGRWLKLFGLKGLMGEILERRVLRSPWDRFIAISDFTKSKLIERSIPAEDIEIIPPIVDVAGTPGASSPPKLGPKSLIVASRHVQYKRVDVALRAVARLAQRHPDLRLSVIGNGPEHENLKALAAELGIAGRVTWHGWLREHKEVLRTLAEHAVYINASQIEGFGISTIEAAALGVPYVASDIPAISYATCRGQGGILFAPGDDRACAVALDRLLSDSAEYQRKRALGIEMARRYSPQTLGPVFEACLARSVSCRDGRMTPAVCPRAENC